ncbi:MAG: helix-turn-helix domain-containing protein [Erythrobacter sp.]
MDSEQENSAENTREEAYAGAGAMLRYAREAEGLSLADIATRTRIPLRQLEVIEAGNFEVLPSRTYAIGFARTYARAMGLDESRITDAVRAELGENSGPRTPLPNAMEPGDPAKLPSKGLAWAGLGAALILALGLFAWFGNSYGAGEGAPALRADPSEEPAEVDDGPTSDDDAASPAAGAGVVVFTALEDGIWVRLFEAGGERLLERTLAKGESFTVPADASDPRINTGRPDALAITIDGEPAARLAERAVILGDAPVSAAALQARAGSALPVAAPVPAPTPVATSRPVPPPVPSPTPVATAAPATRPAPPPSPAVETPAPTPAPVVATPAAQSLTPAIPAETGRGGDN